MYVPGDVLGSYKIISPLGRGSMGVLYVAEHLLIGRRVALKVIASEIAHHPEAVTLFFREARAANQINHPNIIQITDLVEGFADSPTFLVMEILDGYTLREVLDQEKALTPIRVAEIGARIADAMAAAHRVGVIHRDLKPDNIFMCVGGASEIKILDFGIANLSGDSTSSEIACGTPLYISPELAGADGFDERSDVYSLGAMLYEAIAGRPVFDYHSVRDLFVAHVAEAPVGLSLESGAAAELEAIIMSCLAKSPSSRPASMQTIADALTALAETFAKPRSVVDEVAFDELLDGLWDDEFSNYAAVEIDDDDVVLIDDDVALIDDDVILIDDTVDDVVPPSSAASDGGSNAIDSSHSTVVSGEVQTGDNAVPASA